MSTYYHIEHLMEFWNCSFDEALVKIAEVIRGDPEYYLAAYDPIGAVKRMVIQNKRYNIARVIETDDVESMASTRSHFCVPMIIIKDIKDANKYMRFSVGFSRLFPHGIFPKYAQLGRINDRAIKIVFSDQKAKGLLTLVQPNKNSPYRQVSIRGFLNYHRINVASIAGYYYADTGFKQDATDCNIFYLYPENRDIQEI